MARSMPGLDNGRAAGITHCHRMKVVGVIGAGAAGLCAARHVLGAGGMTPVVWEQARGVGGTWVYTPNTSRDEFGLPIHSSMYKNLRTNLPKEVMAFPDFPFPEGADSFLPHSAVLRYLQDYASHHRLLPHIRFKHHVEEVKPLVKDEGPPAWAVTVKDLCTNDTSTTVCDALIVCNGHYSVPRVPRIKELDVFTGQVEHSHHYREAAPYQGLRVVVLGASASGLDIMLELSAVAKEVLLSHNLPVNLPSELPANVRQVRGVVAATPDGFTLADGTTIQADAILYCTGYEYTFPFLSGECGVRVEDNIVKPLYKHLIHSTFPSMAFVGIPFQICPFPLFDFQAQFFVAVLAGRAELPSPGQMAAHTTQALETWQGRGNHLRHYHRLGLLDQLPFLEDWAAGAGIKPPQPYLKTILTIVGLRFLLRYGSFKDYSYVIGGDGAVTEKRVGGGKVHTKSDLAWLLGRSALWLLWTDFSRMCRFICYTVKSKLVNTFH